jgi:hypothetical protein
MPSGGSEIASYLPAIAPEHISSMFLLRVYAQLLGNFAQHFRCQQALFGRNTFFIESFLAFQMHTSL